MSSTESKIEALMTASDLPERLTQALGAGWVASPAQSCMAPELSYGRHAGPAPHTARPAAVVLLLYRHAGRWHLPLTERPDTLARHGGQICLPGGALEPSESSSQAALRELSEELGVEAPVNVLGRLADCYVFASDFVVTPWVAAATFQPHWRPHDNEVRGVVELPLDALTNADATAIMTIQRGPLVFRAPCYRVGRACIWGATSVILSELANVLRHLIETS